MTSLDSVEGALVDTSPAVLVRYHSKSELTSEEWTVNEDCKPVNKPSILERKSIFNKLNISSTSTHANIQNNTQINGVHEKIFQEQEKNGYSKSKADVYPLPGAIPDAYSEHDHLPSEASPVEKPLSRQERVDIIRERRYVDPYVPKHQNGPDCVIQTEDLMTWESDGAVRIHMGTSGMGAQPPISVVTLVTRSASRYPDTTALAVKRNGVWYKWDFEQLVTDVSYAAKGFMKVGLLPFQGVGILGFNSPEWVISDLAAIFAGGSAAGIYTTNGPDACKHVLLDSRAGVCVVEDDIQAAKILQVRDQLPHLKAIVQYMGEPSHPDVLSWADLLEIGKTVPDDALERRIRGIAVNQCATLIYTSGTTGNAKGVMLSHDNLAFTGELVGDMFCTVLTQERVVSYLPLSHVAAQLHDLYICLLSACSPIYFAQPDALKGSLKDTILEVKPTRMLGVPRVWEKMYAALQDREKSMGFIGKKLFAFARKVGAEQARMRNHGSTANPTGHGLASIIHRKVRKGIGFDATVTFVSGAAPLSRDIVEYFHSLDIPIMEIYGMSESSAPHTCNFPFRTRLGTVGRTIPYFETRLHNQTPNGEGEVCMRGRNVFMGYLNQAEKTIEAIDDEGWLHSGDLGMFNDEQYLRITGRIKELLITAGGENVAPVPIEDNIKKELPCINNVMAIGDKRKFLSAILAFKTEIDLDTMIPTDNLQPAAKEWLQKLGCSATTVTEVLQGQNEAVMEAIQRGITTANKQAVSNAQKVQKWVIIPQDFSIPGGELGPTLKLKRPVVYEKYSDVIERLYQEN